MSKGKIVHGNSKDSKKKQHLYKIEDAKISEEDKTFKFGISGKALNKNGSSTRANSQINKLNIKFGWVRFKVIILKLSILGRARALEIEKKIRFRIYEIRK